MVARGACMAGGWVCVVGGGHAWLEGGVCMVGGCMVGGGPCVVGGGNAWLEGGMW